MLGQQTMEQTYVGQVLPGKDGVGRLDVAVLLAILLLVAVLAVA
jgi:hypothetical protein